MVQVLLEISLLHVRSKSPCVPPLFRWIVVDRASARSSHTQKFRLVRGRLYMHRQSFGDHLALHFLEGG